MKIRNGFVSNSSSSSFIVGVGRVTDIEKAKKIRELLPYKEWCFAIETLGKIWEYSHHGELIGQSIVVDNGYGGHVELPVDVHKHDQLYALLTLSNGEGDGEEGDELYQAVYEGGDISLEYFGEQAKLISLTEEEYGVADWRAEYGAARDG